MKRTYRTTLDISFDTESLELPSVKLVGSVLVLNELGIHDRCRESDNAVIVNLVNRLYEAYDDIGKLEGRK